MADSVEAAVARIDERTAHTSVQLNILHQTVATTQQQVTEMQRHLNAQDEALELLERAEIARTERRRVEDEIEARHKAKRRERLGNVVKILSLLVAAGGLFIAWLRSAAHTVGQSMPRLP